VTVEVTTAHGLMWTWDEGSRQDSSRPRSDAPTGSLAVGKRANATLKTLKILTKLRCCPRRATAIVQAILVLHHVETRPTEDEKAQ
jgi:hypothetical protein